MFLFKENIDLTVKQHKGSFYEKLLLFQYGFLLIKLLRQRKGHRKETKKRLQQLVQQNLVLPFPTPW